MTLIFCFENVVDEILYKDICVYCIAYKIMSYSAKSFCIIFYRIKGYIKDYDGRK